MARDTHYDTFKKQKSARLKQVRHTIQFLVVVSLFKAANLWSIRINQWFGVLLGKLAYHLAKKDRGVAHYQLSFCFPEKNEQEREALLRSTFINLGKSVFETLVLGKFRQNAEKWIELENQEVITSALEEGKGALLIFGHLGNWELLGVVCERLGVKGMIVTSQIGDERLARFLADQRNSGGVDLISRSDKTLPLKISKNFKKGGFFIAAYDQDINSVPSVYVDFFGRKAATPRNIAYLAQRYQAPVISAFSRRRQDGTHLFSFRRLSEGEYQQGEAETLRLTQHYSDALETYIRQYPDQWVWHHRRWRNQPDR